MDETVYKIALGALLHDIGKAVQRSQKNPFDKKHGQWGYDWLCDLNLFDTTIINSTITHHKDDVGVFSSNMGIIWYEADNLASSERKQTKKDEKEKWDIYTPLVSPFFKIRNPNNINETLEQIPFLPLKKELIQKTIFEKSKITQEDYAEILSNFKRDLIALSEIGLTLNNLLMLIEKHFSNVPSMTAEIFGGSQENIYKHPDISLYDHMKLTSAIATCMYYYYKERYPVKWNNKEVLRDEILNNNEEAFLLIGGDISGVQKFIYTIASKGALKSLKGRSFFLELLTEHIVSELISEIELSRCNLIFSGGGHFYILAPNTKSAIQKINEVKDGIDNYLFDDFKGAIQIHIETVSFNKDGFSNAVPVWQMLSAKLEQSKKKKWADRIDKILQVEDQDETCKTEYCEVCFREDKPITPLVKEDTEIKVCEPCKSQYNLGRMLSIASRESVPFIVKSKTEKEQSVRIGNYFYSVSANIKLDLKGDIDSIYVINNLQVENYLHPNSIYLPLGSYQHHNMDEIADVVDTFGIARIAVLRMDVDNLGKIFSVAIPEEDRTFSRMASISRNLNYFFKHTLNHIVSGTSEDSLDIANRDVKNKGRMLAIVYSGGDDLFIIGHWLDVFECAYDIRKTFENFTGNKFMTISGGITINHEKYPIYQFARDAEELEKSAKKNSKNSITLFNEKRLVIWDNFGSLLKRIEIFKNYLEKGEKSLNLKEKGLPKTFFYRLLALSRRFNEDGVLILPKCAYLISKIKSDSFEANLKLKEVIMTIDKEEWEMTEIATLLTLMMMRKGGKEDA